MRRRDFIQVVAGSAIAWPLAARAQEHGGMPRIGLLSVFAENDPEAQTWNRELLQRLQELGWANGHNVQIEFRFAGGDEARLSS
jgi:putative ABC transport system substrate-binding protein